ncbi:hypothetical protein V5F40_21680 [Xanthobacter sp. DSM 14520]|uniref:hypothetical protein n=1 Tax=Xanthobacter autotrophicus (strain ATCC BAA-1158 / Py2) TaxID=78245 RepID=UPI0037266CF0
MTYQPPGLYHDVRRERALMLCGAIVPVLCALEAAGLVGVRAPKRVDLLNVDRIDNLVSFNSLTMANGSRIDLRSDAPAALASLDLAVILRPLTEVVCNLPGHAASRPGQPIRLSSEDTAEFRVAVMADDRGIDAWASLRARQVAAQMAADGPLSDFTAARRTLYIQSILILRQVRALPGAAALLGL